MKKTFPVNINGKVFYIDEDAYQLLLNYLDQLRSAFPEAEGDEIVADIESRISELFDERIAEGAHAIVYADVNSVIEIMGKPSDISDDTLQSETSEKAESSEDRNDAPKADENSEKRTQTAIQKKLFRNLNDKMLGGVLGGLATYLDWNVNIMRILYFLLTVITQVWPLTIIYLIAWMIMPPANTPRRVLEMQGVPVTIDTIGQNVLSSTPPPYNGAVINNNSNLLSSVFSVIGKFIMGFLGLTGVCGALVSTGFFLFFIIAFISYTCFGSITLISGFDYDALRTASRFGPTLACAAYMCFAMSFMIPSIALAWTSASVLFNAKGATKTIIIFAVAMEIIIVVATIVLMLFWNELQYHPHYHL